MQASVVDFMGSDLTIVNAARVSFGKRAEKLDEKYKKLIDYLAKHEHWTPFAHTCISFHIKAPLFVARQLGKHQVGLVWNEISRRYVDFEPEFHIPEVWRAKSINRKQGSDPIKTIDMGTEEYEKVTNENMTQYTKLIKAGVAPEQARMVLPQSMYTEWYWTGSLYSFSRVCELRLSVDVQEETRFLVQDIYSECLKLFPYSWKALCCAW